MSTRYDEDREKAERDPRRNEAIFDGGCARFVPKEGHDFCHGQDMGIVGTIHKGAARKSKGTNLLGTPWKGASTPRSSKTGHYDFQNHLLGVKAGRYPHPRYWPLLPQKGPDVI